MRMRSRVSVVRSNMMTMRWQFLMIFLRKSQDAEHIWLALSMTKMVGILFDMSLKS